MIDADATKIGFWPIAGTRTGPALEERTLVGSQVDGIGYRGEISRIYGLQGRSCARSLVIHGRTQKDKKPSARGRSRPQSMVEFSFHSEWIHMALEAAKRNLVDAPKGAPTSQKVIAESVANELIFGIVGHVGSGNTTVAETLKKTLEGVASGGRKYKVAVIKARTVIEESMKRLGQRSPLPKIKSSLPM